MSALLSRLTTPNRWKLVASLLLLVGLGLRLAHIAWRFDIDWEPDSYQHALIVQEATSRGLSGLWMILDPWAKPIFSSFAALFDLLLPHAWPLLPALQVANTAIWLTTCWIVGRLAEEALEEPFARPLALALGLFGYVTFKDSIAAMTEPVGALLVALALDSVQRGRPLRGLLFAGFAPLARLDALLLTAIQWVDEVCHGPRTPRRIAICAAVCAAPLVAWGLIGALHTSSPRFVLGSYKTDSPYGRGSCFYFARQFFRLEPAVVIGLGLAALGLASRPRELPRVVRLAIAQALVYGLALSAMWARGKFIGELLRYFVVAYPCYLLAATAGIVRLTRLRGIPRWTAPALLATVLAVEAFELGRLLQPTINVHSQINSLASLDSASAPYQALHGLAPSLADKPIYADRPEALYYLRQRHGIYSAPGPREVTRADLHGYFVFSGNWSESLGAKRADFDALRLVAHLPPDIDVYEKP